MGELERYWDLIRSKSDKYNLDPCLVGAIILTESSAEEAQVRFEPGYKWLYSPEKVKPRVCSKETERILQKISWGLMQIMGAVARERGLGGWLTELLNPETNIEYGCAHLAYLQGRFKEMDMVVSAYNMGHPRRKATGHFVNQGYVSGVMEKYLVLKNSRGNTK